MSKYTYPALFDEEKQCSNCKGGYAVTFPDWDGYCCAATCGKNLRVATFTAIDLLSIMCVDAEDDPDKGMPRADSFTKDPDKLYVPIEVDTDYYRKVLAMCKKGRYRRRMIWKVVNRPWGRK